MAIGLVECHRNSTLNNAASRPLGEGPSPPPGFFLGLLAWCSGMCIAGRMTPSLCTLGSPENHASARAPAPHSARTIPAAPHEPRPRRETQPRPGSPGSYHSEAGAGPATSPFRAGAEEDAGPLCFPLAPAVRLDLSRRLRPCRTTQTPW